MIGSVASIVRIYRKSCCLAGMYILILLIKCIIFGYLISSSDDMPILSVQPYSIRIISTYMSFSSLLLLVVLLCNSAVISVLAQLLTDVWLIGNLMYFRSYSDLLNSWCIQNVSNLEGLWSSILVFLEWKDLCFVALTILWVVVLIFLRHQQYKWNMHHCIIPCVVVIFVSFIPSAITSFRSQSPVNPFATYYHDVSMGRVWYSNNYSPIAHGINELINLVSRKDTPVLPPAEVELAPFLNKTETYIPPKASNNLLLIFFESLESWVINCTVEGKEITPNLNRLLKQPSVSYIPEVIPQVKQGMSSDAQLIVHTGLLPIRDGAVSMRFPYNHYYCLANAVEFADKRVYVPTPASEWNQGALTATFGFDTLIAYPMSDRQIVHLVTQDICTGGIEEPFFLFFVTMASHAPFTIYADSSTLQLPISINTELRNYLQCVHYTDACLAPLIDTVLSTSLASQTTMVVLGDHNIFYEDKRNVFQTSLPECQTPLKGTIPWILQTPLAPAISISDTVFQMDVYPTLLSLFGGNNYYWKGFGRNLYDTVPRCITQDSAFILSDKIINSDYFSH